MTRNWHEQQYEAPGVTPIAGIHRPARRAKIYVDEENKSQYGSDSDDVSNIDEDGNDFQPHNNYTSDEENKNDKDKVVENC